MMLKCIKFMKIKEYLILYILFLKWYSSSLISSIINIIIRTLSSSEGEIIELKNKENFKEAEKSLPKIKKILIIKFILFFLISILFLILFWYY